MSPMITFLVVLLASFVGAFTAATLKRMRQEDNEKRFNETLHSLNNALRNRDKLLSELIREQLTDAEKSLHPTPPPPRSKAT